MTKKLIIFRYKELFNILEEIKENFEFKLEFYEKERELENLENNNLTDYLVITKKKLIIIVCDNGGFAVINRLQLFKGGKEYNNLLKSSITPGLVDVDFAKHAESMGAKSEHVNSISDLEAAFKLSLIHI